MLDAVRSLTMNLIDGQLTETAWQSAEAIEDLRHRRIRSRERWQRRARARLINPGGEDINSDWDGIWEAATARLTTGWSAEIRIPILTLAFKPGLHEWQFNIQRRIQRRLETDRWASPNRQYEITQTSQAGLLTSLPDFDLGKGLTIRPAITSGGGVPAPDARVEGDFQPSLDVNQRIGANVLASGTVNTDFAETEVDTRRTNLTRFPLFFPEKRTFFIEGDDIFSFGLVLYEMLSGQQAFKADSAVETMNAILTEDPPEKA